MENPQLTLRSLKGAPLSVLLALRLAEAPLPQKALTLWTGYSDKTVAAALDLLVNMGLAAAHGRGQGWSLAPAAVPLLQALAGATAAPTETEEADTAVTNDDPDTAVPPTPPTRKISGSNTPRRKFSVSAPSSSVEILSTGQSRKEKRPSAAEKPPVFYLLRQAGIGISMSDTLSQLAWVTVPYAQAHLDKIRRDGHPLNYAIHRMREGDAPPTCDCGHCDPCRERYLARLGLLDVVTR